MITVSGLLATMPRLNVAAFEEWQRVVFGRMVFFAQAEDGRVIVPGFHWFHYSSQSGIAYMGGMN